MNKQNKLMTCLPKGTNYLGTCPFSSPLIKELVDLCKYVLTSQISRASAWNTLWFEGHNSSAALLYYLGFVYFQRSNSEH
jgi:hypothetical protein